MATRTLVISDFSGGVNKNLAENIGMNESEVCDGFYPIEGNLRSFDGNQIISLGKDFEEPQAIASHTTFYKTGHAINNTLAASNTVDGWIVTHEWDGTTEGGGQVMACWIGKGEIASGCAANSTTIQVTEPAAHSQKGYIVVKGTDLISYTDNDGLGVLSGCSSHPAYSGGEDVVTRYWFPISRNSLGRAFFATLGGRLYFTAYIGSTYYLMRWDGNFYNIGTCSASTTTVTGVGTSWSTYSSAVRQGDLIYFNNGAGNWEKTDPERITAIGSNTSITIRSSHTVTSGKYVIVRTHPAGIAVPATTGATLTPGAAGAMDDGVYYYAITYANSQTGNESNPTILGSATTSAGAGTGSVSINFPNEVTTARTTDVWSDRWQVDQIKIYRTKVGTTTPYYYVATSTPAAATYLFSTDYVDTTHDDSLSTTEAPAYNDTPPSGITKIVQHANRLYGWGKSGNENRLYFSTLSSPEYWPANVYQATTSTAAIINCGGYVDAFPAGRKIMGVASEGGAFGATGFTGGPLLVLGEQYGRRWFGNDWEEFGMFDAFRETCIATRSLVNCDGWMIWMSRNGPVMVQSGSNQVIPLYHKLFPVVSRPFWRQIYGNLNSVTYNEEISGSFWNSWYILTYPSTHNYNDTTVFLYVPSIKSGEPVFVVGEGATYPITASDFSVWQGGYDNNECSWGVGPEGGPLND